MAERSLNAAIVEAEISRSFEEYLGIFDEFYADDVELSVRYQADDRDEIVRLLRVTSGRVGGPDGAAARMGIKRTTLISRLKKLGIDRSKLS
jgi:transcriptional regulator with GAF, ATPase, and Fis domain